MKGIYIGCLFFFASFAIVFDCFAQPPFTSAASGNWNLGATWGRAANVPGTDYPIAGQAATIATGTTVTVPTGTFAVGNLTLANSNTAILNIDGALQVNGAITGGTTRGFLNVNTSGRLLLNDGATVQAAWSRLFIKNGGGLEMNYSTGGTVPACTYETGSILRFTGYTSTTATTPTFESSIALQNVEWNCASQGNDIFFNGTMPSLSGYLKVISTGPLPWYLVLTSSAAYTATIGGNLEVSTGGYLVLTDGAAASTVTVNGNVSVITTGSQLDLKQSTGIGTLNVKGNFTLTNGTIGTFGAGGGELVFNGTATQTFSRTGGTITAAVNYTVFDFSLLDLGVNALTGAGKITLNNNSTLYVASTDVSGAIQLSPTSAGNIQVSGIRTYSSSSNIVYNGAAAQKLGNGFPSNVNLEIANTNGVTNNNVGTTNFVGNLTLTTGALHIGSSNTLNIQSNFFTTINGSIGGDATSNLTFSGSGTMNTLRFASTKELLNNLTVSRIADLVLGSSLTISGTINLSGGNLDFSGQTLTMNGGSITSSATGLKSSSTSNLTFGGSTFTGSIPFSGAGNQLNTLTFATNGGAYTWNSGVTVNTSVYLTAGTLTHTSGITMAANSTIFKGAGSITSSSPVAATSYNVTYTGTGNTGLELPTTATALNNLTIASSGTVTLAATGITVNGDLLISGGTFAAGANNFTVKGANWTISGGVFTPGTGTVSFSATTAIGGTGTTSFNNLTVTGTGILTLPSNTMNISSNLVNDGTINKGTGIVAFAGTTAITGTGTTSFNNVVVNASSSLTAPSATMNVAADFTNNGTFTHNSGTVLFNGTSTVAGTVVPTFGNIIVTGTFNAPANLNLHGDLRLNDGVFNHNSGTVTFNGPLGSQSLNRTVGTGAITYTLFNVVIDKAAGAFFVDSNIAGTTFRVENQFTISRDGTSNTDVDFDGGTGAGTLVLMSTSTRTARIPAVPVGTSVVGNLTVERFVSNSIASRAYRYLAPPVIGSTVADWKNEIQITGLFSDPSTGAGIPDPNSPSMYRFIETTGGTASNRYQAYPNNVSLPASSFSLTNGTGYAIYVRATGTPTLDTRGTLLTGDLPVSLTITGSEANAAGFNLVGNPYPAPIDWDLFTLPASVSSTISLKDNVDNAGAGTGNFVYYVKNGPNVGGFTGVIASGQAFWVQTTANATLTFSETLKAADINPILVRARQIADVLRIKIKGNGKEDESVIWLKDGATDGSDLRFDAKKMPNDHLNLYSYLGNSGNVKYAINGVGPLGCSKNFKLGLSDLNSAGVNVVQAGTYTYNFSEFESFTKDYNFSLVDKFSNKVIDIKVNPAYVFVVTADTLSFGDHRFELLITQPDTKTDNLLLYNDVCQNAGASITVENTQSSVFYEVRNQQGQVISDVVAGNGRSAVLNITKEKLINGVNNLLVYAKNSTCDPIPLKQSVVLKVNEIYSVLSVSNGSSCQSGSVTLNASGIPSDGQYYWYETETATVSVGTGAEWTTPVLQKTKTYFVAAKNSLNCEGARVPVKAEIIQYNPAVISESGGILKSSYAANNQWYFNNTAIPGATNQEIIPDKSGVYKLEVTISGCKTTAEYIFSVTGIEDTNLLKLINVYPNPIENKVRIELNNTEPAIVKIVNSVGASMGEISLSIDGNKQKGEFNLGSEPAGLYLLKIVQNKKVINYKVIKK